MTKYQWLILGAAGAMLALATACSGGDAANDATPQPTQTLAARTPAATNTATVIPTSTSPAVEPTQPAGGVTPVPTSPPPPATQPPPPPPPPTQTPAGQALTFVGKDTVFVPRSGTATPGVPLTITLDNQDAGVAHDLVIFGPSGDEAGRTDVVSGPVVQSFTFTPSPGRYAFKCSVHPQTMTGAVTVQ